MFEELEKLMKENHEVLIRMKNEEGPRNPNFETDGYHNGSPVYCPVNAYGDCPFCDQCSLCRMSDPIESCGDFGAFWDSWEEYDNANDVDPNAPELLTEDEIKWASDVYGYEDTWEDNDETN